MKTKAMNRQIKKSLKKKKNSRKKIIINSRYEHAYLPNLWFSFSFFHQRMKKSQSKNIKLCIVLEKN